MSNAAKTVLLIAALFLTACAGHTGAPKRLDAWQVTTMGGGGTTYCPTISPHDSNTAMVFCDMTGGYITHDAGESWRMFNLHTGVDSFAFDPSDPKVIYAGNIGLWRSGDAGRTWAMIWPDPAKITETQHGDHAENYYHTPDPIYPRNVEAGIEAIAIDPANSKRIALAQVGQIVCTQDGGKTWRRWALGSDAKTLCLSAAASPGNLLAIQTDGVRLLNGGPIVVQRTLPPGGTIVSASVGLSSSGTPIIYALTAAKREGSTIVGGLCISHDLGQTWEQATAKLFGSPAVAATAQPPNFTATRIACSEKHADTAYVGFGRLLISDKPEDNSKAGGDEDEVPANLATKVFNGIAKTTDGGQTWTIVHKETLVKGSNNLQGSWVEKRMAEATGLSDGTIWFDVPRGLGVAPSDPDVCYATDLFRAYRTLDGGRTWQEVNSKPVGKPEENRWASRGMDVTTVYDLQFDPFDINHLFLPMTDMGMWRSPDAGKSWIGATVGVPGKWRNTTYAIAFDPQVKGLIWGAFAANHDLPRFKMWRNRGTDGFKGGVCVSTDDGKTWTVSNTGMPETATTHILLDPDSPPGMRTLYACGFGTGVFKSTDNGRTWTLKNNGIKQEKPKAWRVTRAVDGTLYLVVAHGDAMAQPGGEFDGAIYKSTDKAETWASLPLPQGVNFPTGMQVDPRDPRRIYLTSWGVFAPEADIPPGTPGAGQEGPGKPKIRHGPTLSGGGDTGGGAYVSTDGGQTWKNIFSEGPHTYDLTIDPHHPEVLYVTGFNSGVWRSTDAGQNWNRVRGFNFKWGHRVIVDKAHPDMIYVVTFGGGLWHGPAAGDPESTEDILTPIARQE